MDIQISMLYVCLNKDTGLPYFAHSDVSNKGTEKHKKLTYSVEIEKERSNCVVCWQVEFEPTYEQIC